MKGDEILVEWGEKEARRSPMPPPSPSTEYNFFFQYEHVIGNVITSDENEKPSYIDHQK